MSSYKTVSKLSRGGKREGIEETSAKKISSSSMKNGDCILQLMKVKVKMFLCLSTTTCIYVWGS